MLLAWLVRLWATLHDRVLLLLQLDDLVHGCDRLAVFAHQRLLGDTRGVSETAQRVEQVGALDAVAVVDVPPRKLTDQLTS